MPNLVAIDKSSIRGSLAQGLKGEPVVLDLNLRLKGKPVHQRFAFSFTDMKFNARQMEVLALQVATETIVKQGKKLKVVPHALLDDVEAYYLKRQAKVEETLNAVIDANGGMELAEIKEDQRLGSAVEKSKKARAGKVMAKFSEGNAKRKKLRAERRKANRAKMKASLDKRLKMKKLASKPINPSALKWAKLSGKAKDIAVGPNGAVWAIGTGKESGGYGIYKWSKKKWSKIKGSAVRIAVDRRGNAWVVNSKDEIYRHDGKKWAKMQGKAKDIAFGANGAAWIIGTGKEAGGFGIYKWANKKWTKVKGSAMRVVVDPKGNPWVINNKSEIYRHDGKKWTKMAGKARDIAIGANGTAWMVGTGKATGGYSLHLWSKKKWTKIKKGAVGVAAGPDGYAWVFDSKGTIYKGPVVGARRAGIVRPARRFGACPVRLVWGPGVQRPPIPSIGFTAEGSAKPLRPERFVGKVSGRRGLSYV